jgi:hypothetical protein
MRGILIDAEARTIAEVEHTGKLPEMYSSIRCTEVEFVPLDDENDLWVDGEGRINDTSFGFIYSGHPAGPHFFGNALILSLDHSNGECIAAKISLDAVRSRVSFWVKK